MKLPTTELLLLALLAAPGARALTTDREQPIEIEADSADADDAKKITIYKGDVVITQGTLRITGEHVTIRYDANGDFSELISLGTPARFRQLPDGKPDAEQNYQRARASRMEYYKDKDTIVLLGNAIYGQGGDQVAADRIDYDSKNSRMKARTVTAGAKKDPAAGTPPQKGRVRITIQPKKK
jgi:lipopolysaccharide export system protein LptA